MLYICYQPFSREDAKVKIAKGDTDGLIFMRLGEGEVNAESDQDALGAVWKFCTEVDHVVETLPRPMRLGDLVRLDGQRWYRATSDGWGLLDAEELAALEIEGVCTEPLPENMPGELVTAPMHVAERFRPKARIEMTDLTHPEEEYDPNAADGAHNMAIEPFAYIVVAAMEDELGRRNTRVVTRAYMGESGSEDKLLPMAEGVLKALNGLGILGQALGRFFVSGEKVNDPNVEVVSAPMAGGMAAALAGLGKPAPQGLFAEMVTKGLAKKEDEGECHCPGCTMRRMLAKQLGIVPPGQKNDDDKKPN